ncbi:MAG: integration host factor subunit alpha [Clostridium sp. CAG:307_30_263]|nr:MAG: integration host factor subunit alpha [Clostridium sp. CAG:307_30_263]
MNKSELVYEVTNRLDVTRKEAEDVIDCFLELIAENLANGDKVVLSGFGTFEIRNRVSRSGVNPRTGERIDIPCQKTPAFKVGKILKDKLR